MIPEGTNSISLNSSHISDEELIRSLYSEEQNHAHLVSCPACRQRRDALQWNRKRIELDQLPTVDLSTDHLAAQRRRIYARLSKPQPVWSSVLGSRWVSAAATVLVLGGGLFVFEHRQAVPQEDRISDADLAQEVSQLSQSGEPLPADPLKGLFE